VKGVKAQLKLSVPEARAGYTYSRVVTSRRLASTVLVSVLVWEFAVLLLQASRNRFWSDELLTFHVSNIHPFSRLWRALYAGIDGMTPGYYVMAKLGRMLPGDPLVTLRLPSILGYLLTLLGVYWFVTKRLSTTFGLIAVVLITLSEFRVYALQARSYSLLVGLLAISAVFWQRIDQKRFMTPLFAVFLTLAVSCHYYAAVIISSFGIAELAWTLLSRRIRWGVWTSCLLATSPFFVTLPFLLHMRDISGKDFWAQPSWSMAGSTYWYYLGIGDHPEPTVLLILLFFVLVVSDSLLRMIWQPREGMNEREFSAPEIILVTGFLFYPAFLVVFTKILGSAGYHPRYGLPGILGLVLGSVYLVRTLWFKSSSYAYLLAALLFGFAIQGYKDFRMLKADSNNVDERWTGLAELTRSEPGIAVVMADPLAFLEASEYAPPELRDRLVQIVDPKARPLLAQFIPLHIEDLAAFQATHQKFIFRSGGSFDWLTQYLLAAGYHLRLLSKDAGSSISIYMAEK
jgi:hypothetical protein